MKKIILSTLGVILGAILLYGISFYFSFFQGDIYVKNGIVQGNTIKKENLQNYSGLTINFETNNNHIEEISDLNLSILNKKIPDNIPILLQSHRHYIPVTYLAKIFNFKFSNLTLKNSNLNIDLSNSKEWLINKKKYSPRGNLLTYNNEIFISLSDIEFLFNLTAIFDEKTNSIALLKSYLNKIELNNLPLKDGKVALFRFEDVSAGSSFSLTNAQTKFKAMADYLYKNNFKFNVAWVPRYIHPENNIDNDLLKENTFSNIGFINMLDYLINSNGQIGLHGYTHQSGDTISTVGSELTKNDNSTSHETIEVIEKALSTAANLNIPVNFFESPHYHATKSQKELIGQYFQYQYEPYNLLNYIGLKITKHDNLFIPTPLGYIRNRDPAPQIKKIQNPPPNFLASMFYHPSLELDYITINNSNNYFDASFSDNSILTKLISTFIENGYTSIHPTDFGN